MWDGAGLTNLATAWLLGYVMSSTLSVGAVTGCNPHSAADELDAVGGEVLA